MLFLSPNDDKKANFVFFVVIITTGTTSPHSLEGFATYQASYYLINCFVLWFY